MTATFAKSISFLALFVLTIVPGSVMGQVDVETRPLTQELLPETTVSFIQIDNFADMMQKMSESAGAQLIQDEQIAPLVDGLWDQVKTVYDNEAKEEVGLDLEDFQNLPKGEMCFAVIAPRRKNPEFFLLMELDAESDSMQKVLDRGRQLIEEEGESPIESEDSDDGFKFEYFNVDGKRIKYFEKDGLLVGCTSEEELDAFIDRWMGRPVDKVRPLSQNRKFVTIMNRCTGNNEIRPEARFFVDPIGIAKSATRGNFAASASLNFLPVFGLDGLAGIGGSMLLSEDDFESIIHGHVLLANPRKGVFEMIAMKPTMYEPEPWIPADVNNYATTSWDFEQMLIELTKIIENFYEPGTVDEWIEKNINQQVGFDLKEDVLANISGRVTMAQWLEEPVRINSQLTVLSVEIKDLESFEKSIELVFDAINAEADEDDPDRMEEIEYKGIRVWTANRERIEERMAQRQERLAQRAAERGREVNAELEFNVQTPAFALIGDYLVFSQSLTAIQKAIDVHQGDEEALVNELDYAKVSETMNKLLKNEMPVAMFYSNPEEALRLYYELITSDETRSFIDNQIENSDDEKGRGYLQGFKDTFDQNPLPEFDELRKYFQPSGAIVTDDDTGFHFLAFQKRFDPHAEEEVDKK